MLATSEEFALETFIGVTGKDLLQYSFFQILFHCCILFFWLYNKRKHISALVNGCSQLPFRLTEQLNKYKTIEKARHHYNE